MSTEESSSMRLSTGLNIEVGHSDLPALRLISTFFNMMEGPLWKQIRGLGLAYGFDFSFSVLRGLVSFSASQASDVVQVYEEVKKFVDSLASEDGDSVNELTLQVNKLCSLGYGKKYFWFVPLPCTMYMYIVQPCMIIVKQLLLYYLK